MHLAITTEDKITNQSRNDAHDVAENNVGYVDDVDEKIGLTGMQVDCLESHCTLNYFAW